LFSNCTAADTIFSLGKFQESEPHPSLVELPPVPPTLPLQQIFDTTLIFILGGGRVDAKAKDAAMNIKKNPKAPPTIHFCVGVQCLFGSCVMVRFTEPSGHMGLL